LKLIQPSKYLSPSLSVKLTKQNTENHSLSFQLVKEIFNSPLPNEPLQATKSMAKAVFFLTPTRLGKLLCYLETNNLQNSKWKEQLIDVFSPSPFNISIWPFFIRINCS